jgi:dihydrofolate reductase
MGKVNFIISMSLDGFVTGANVRPEAPLGDGGEKLHEWVTSEDKRNRDILTQGVSAAGAVITGRRNYNYSIPWWGADGPTGSDRLPVFVVCHTVPEDMPKGGVYIFVNGIEAALARAQTAAGDKDVNVMGGANIAQQFIRAGLVDEIHIQLVPVLFGSGTRLFEHLGVEHIPLETMRVIETPEAIHLGFRVVK